LQQPIQELINTLLVSLSKKNYAIITPYAYPFKVANLLNLTNAIIKIALYAVIVLNILVNT
jgi:hypothetical protein